MYIGVCYKSSTVTEEEEKDLFTLIQDVSIHQVIIMGDFYYARLSWEGFEADNNDVKLLDLVQDRFCQHADRPTRGGNILDLVLTSKAGMVEHLLVNELFSNSDHNVVAWDLISSMVITRGNKKEYYAFNKGNYEYINNYLKGVNWVTELQELDVEGMWEAFLNKINCYSATCSLMEVNICSTQPDSWRINHRTYQRST